VAGLRAAFDAVLRDDAAGALQYGPTPGHRPLRELVAERLGRRGIRCTAGEVLITTGVAAGARPGGAARWACAVPARAGRVPELRRRPAGVSAATRSRSTLCRWTSAACAWTRWWSGSPRGAAGRPPLLYTVRHVPEPVGVTMAAERRRELLEPLAGGGLPVVEDDPYSELRYEGEPVPRSGRCAVARTSSTSARSARCCRPAAGGLGGRGPSR